MTQDRLQTTTSRILSSPFNCFPRLCVQVADDFPEFPLVISLPSGTSATSEDTSYCSAPSSVLRRCQTARQRACKDYGHWPSLTVPPIFRSGTAELSRFSSIECPRMHRVFDSAGPNSNLLLARCSWCLPDSSTRSAPRTPDFGAQWLAYVSPVNASRAVSRSPAHDSGP